MTFDPQILLGGLFLGSLYGTAALGFQLLLGAAGRVHLAYGHLWVAGALGLSTLMARCDLPLSASFAVLVAAGGLAGWLFHPGVLFRGALTEERARSFFLVTLGAALMLEEAGARLWPLPGSALVWAPPPLVVAGVALPPAKLALVGTGICVAAGFHIYLRRNRWGRALVAWNRGAAPVWFVGVDTGLLGRRAAALGLSVCALSSAFLALSYTVSVREGMAMTVRCLVLAVLGGTLSPLGVLGAGVGLGIGESLVGHVLGLRWGPALGYVGLLGILPVLARRSGR